MGFATGIRVIFRYFGAGYTRLDTFDSDTIAFLAKMWFEKLAGELVRFCPVFSPKVNIRRVGHPKFAETILDLSLLVGVPHPL